MRFAYALLTLASLVLLASSAPTQRLETDPELTAGYFQGDLVVNEQRNGIISSARHWPNRVVYYRFHEGSFDADHRNHILRGMRLIEDVSCIRFKEAQPEQKSYMNITGMPGGCYSSVGWQNAVQTYNLQVYPLDQGCFRLGTIVHEMLHTVGFYHMQSAPDRDDYVQIVEANVQNGMLHNFNKYSDSTVEHFDEVYDYGSVMHYPAYAFSANGEMTIVPLREEASGIMGQRVGMSKSDINRLNVMYRCPQTV